MHYIEMMRPIIQEAGNLAARHFRGPLEIKIKKDLSIATNIDLAVQELLIDKLCRALPGSGYIAEETKHQEIKEFTWIIDPIDGTKNYTKGIPYFCINVALEHHREVVASMTYAPIFQDLFYAQKDFGFWHNDVQINLRQKKSDQEGLLIVVSDFKLRHGQMLNKIKEALRPESVRFRVNGSVALDMAYASAGFFDAVIFEDLHWWDAAAGTLLIDQAGGMIYQQDGKPVDASFRSVIAGRQEIVDTILVKVFEIT